jgi:hypothetical protein
MKTYTSPTVEEIGPVGNLTQAGGVAAMTYDGAAYS